MQENFTHVRMWIHFTPVPHSYQINIIFNHNLSRCFSFSAVLRFYFVFSGSTTSRCGFKNQKVSRCFPIAMIIIAPEWEQWENGKKYDLLFIIGARIDQIGLTTNGQLELVIVFCRGAIAN